MAERVAAVILLRDDGAALLQLRDDKPGLRHAAMWVPPGGHCEPGEDTLQAARRELLEESQYRVEQLHFLVSMPDSTDGFDPLELSIYWARHDGRQQTVCREGQALEFINRCAASSLPIPPHLLAAWDLALQRSGLFAEPTKTA